MKIKQAVRAWLLLLAACPKGIATFALAVTGICLGVSLLIVWIGIPILVATLVACRALLSHERMLADGWLKGRGRLFESPGSDWAAASKRMLLDYGSIRQLRILLTERRTYMSVLYCLLQLPIGLAAFVVASTLPLLALGLALAPFSYMMNSWLPIQISSFDYLMIPGLTGLPMFPRVLAAGGVGIVLLALMPLLLRSLGRLYAGWLHGLGEPPTIVTPLSGVSAKPLG